MPFTTLNLGLTLTIPQPGTKNYGPSMLTTTWTKISSHRHTGSGDGNQLTAASLVDYCITKDKVTKNLGLHQAAAMKPNNTSQNIDFATGNNQVLNLGLATDTVFVTLANPATGATYIVWVQQGATARDINWPASVLWPQGVKPILTDANAKARIELYYDGVNYLGIWDVDFR